MLCSGAFHVTKLAFVNDGVYIFYAPLLEEDFHELAVVGCAGYLAELLQLSHHAHLWYWRDHFQFVK